MANATHRRRSLFGVYGFRRWVHAAGPWQQGSRADMVPGIHNQDEERELTRLLKSQIHKYINVFKSKIDIKIVSVSELSSVQIIDSE